MQPVNDETREDQTCGNLDTLSLKVFGVTRGLALPLSELLAVLQLHASRESRQYPTTSVDTNIGNRNETTHADALVASQVH